MTKKKTAALPAGLIALALGGFGIGLTEFGPVGLLPQIATDFSVTESVAGYLVSGYALAVAFGAIAITAAFSRSERKKVLLSLVVLFIVGNLISALASTYGVMLAGRIIAALCHGGFFGIGAVLAASMVEEKKKAGAISLMFAGLTVANVVGIPFGTFVGQQLGWRATFWAITGIGIITFLGIQFLVERSRASETAGLRTEPRSPPSPAGAALCHGEHLDLRWSCRCLHLHRLHSDRGQRIRDQLSPMVAAALRGRNLRRQHHRRQAG